MSALGAALPHQPHRRAEARRRARAGRPGAPHPSWAARPSCAPTSTTVQRARALLDQYEALWRGRIDRMADCSPTPTATHLATHSQPRYHPTPKEHPDDRDRRPEGHPTALTMTVRAEFDAPVDQVWQLWADPRKLERWWGPPTYPATVRAARPAPGGSVTYFMTSPEGQRHHGWWRVLDVQAPRTAAGRGRVRRRRGRAQPRRCPPPSCASSSPTGPRVAPASASSATSRPPKRSSRCSQMGMEEGLRMADGPDGRHPRRLIVSAGCRASPTPCRGRCGPGTRTRSSTRPSRAAA